MIDDFRARITRDDIEEALAALDGGETHGFGPSVFYDLLEGGKRYPPKAVPAPVSSAPSGPPGRAESGRSRHRPRASRSRRWKAVRGQDDRARAASQFRLRTARAEVHASEAPEKEATAN